MVESLALYVDHPEHLVLLRRLSAAGVSRPMKAREVKEGGPLFGSSFCVTGVLSRKREDVHADIVERGGTIHDKVKKGTTYLVVGEKVGQSKLDSAKKNLTKILTESELLALFEASEGEGS
jgi:DNA ligase (NAD+)